MDTHFYSVCVTILPQLLYCWSKCSLLYTFTNHINSKVYIQKINVMESIIIMSQKILEISYKHTNKHTTNSHKTSVHWARLLCKREPELSPLGQAAPRLPSSEPLGN